MAECADAETLPALTYEYKCENCRHVWQVLSQQEVGLECSKCGSTRIRVPRKRGTYKYKCEKCDSKWKKKNSTGGVGFCPTCSNGLPAYPYKFRPDPPKRMFGEFVCSKCDREWKSGNAWEGRGQQCMDCKTMNLPTVLRPLRPPRFPPDGIQKPHPMELCERCKELGYNCRNTASHDDDESVISTSDSSLASEGRHDDTTPVPSNHGSDIGDIDELVEELDQLGFD